MRAHNWVALGALLENPGKPAWYLPISGRLYFRASQLPPRQGMSGPTVEFRTKCELAVELIRQQARLARGQHLAIFDGAFALRSVVRPLALPGARGPAGRVPHPAAARRPALRPAADGAARGQAGAQAEVGRAAAAAAAGGPLAGPWHTGEAFIYGRVRQVRWKEVVCLWRVLGHEVPVKAVVADVEGYKKRFTLVTSAVGLTGLQMVELFAARFRQEDGFRDLKQRLGWEECRAWTRNPIERTSQVQWVALSLMRLAQYRLEEAGDDGLVDAAALEQGQGPAQRAGRGTAVQAARRGNPPRSLGLAGGWREFRRRSRLSGARSGPERGYEGPRTALPGRKRRSAGLGRDAATAGRRDGTRGS